MTVFDNIAFGLKIQKKDKKYIIVQWKLFLHISKLKKSFARAKKTVYQYAHNERLHA